ncbi:hypothetical protein D9757_012249 [Collybiopsis confluens]|uniref:F-box domain-containing protein n=1 Tax=Collybiopsis confluens TaxID=2823264 RepID=A0A8H5LIW2_9AGAR|nr:hypothetical protein D9757_012249 [Collybiopsis confluens]
MTVAASMSSIESLFCSNCRSKLDTLEKSSTDDFDYQDFIRNTRTNQCPWSSQERSRIAASLDESSKDLERYDRAIRELEGDLARLKELRDDARRRRVESRISLLSPLRKLPPEVLLQIFSYGGGEMILANTNAKPIKVRSRVFGMSWVCYWWRSLLISERRMWASLEMVFNVENEANPSDFSRELFDFIAECFQKRGGDFPRSIVLKLLGHINPRFDRRMLILDILLQVSQYWQVVELNFTNNYEMLKYLMRQLANTQASGSLLERLEVAYFDDPYTPGYALNLLSGFQNLTQLDFLEIPLIAWSDQVHFSNLTSLVLREYSGTSLAELLIQLPVLETFSLERFTLKIDSNENRLEPRSEQDQRQVYHHTSLSRLVVGVSSHARHICRGLSVPKLTFLGILFWEDDVSSGFQELASMLNRSHCTLSEIQAYDDKCEEETHTELWESFLASISSVIGKDASLTRGVPEWT